MNNFDGYLLSCFAVYATINVNCIDTPDAYCSPSGVTPNNASDYWTISDP